MDPVELRVHERSRTGRVEHAARWRSRNDRHKSHRADRRGVAAATRRRTAATLKKVLPRVGSRRALEKRWFSTSASAPGRRPGLDDDRASALRRNEIRASSNAGQARARARAVLRVWQRWPP